MQSRSYALDWARFASLVAAAVSGVYLLWTLASAYFLVTTDWRAFACFDGTERACKEPAPQVGLSTVPASAWILASIAVAATLVALIWAPRLRRVAYAAPVVLLCATSAGIAYALVWSRL